MKGVINMGKYLYKIIWGGGVESYVKAYTRQQAINKFKAEYPDATIKSCTCIRLLGRGES